MESYATNEAKYPTQNMQLFIMCRLAIFEIIRNVKN